MTAAYRIAAYMDERAKMSGLSPEIHTLHLNTDQRQVLSAYDLRCLLVEHADLREYVKGASNNALKMLNA
jgi:hypothetical protein